jgi:hypothetical protein
MKWVIRIYALVLLAYTGWRTYDFMVHQLPSGETGMLLALLFLFATEAGLALWHEISLRHTTTQEQHYTAVALTWIDFAGSLAAGIADMILRQTFAEGYVLPPLLVTFLIFGLPLIVALNIAGVLVYLANDSELQLDRAKRELRHEIHRQAIRELHDNTGAIAEGMKKDIYRRLRDDVTGKLAKQYLADPKTAQLPPHTSSNGKVVYNQEAEPVEVTDSKNGPREGGAK